MNIKTAGQCVLFFFMLTLFSSRANVQQSLSGTAGKLPCENYLNRTDSARNAYFGPDNQIVGESQFRTDPYLPPTESLIYLRRISVALKKRGILPLIVTTPPEGFAFLGKLDPETIKGTIFENLSSPRMLSKIQSGYSKTLLSFQKTGFETPNILNAMLLHQSKTPDAKLYFKHDAHWHPDGTQAAALGVRSYLLDNFPKLFSEINTEKYSVITKEMIMRTSLGGWDGVILQSCPDHKPLPEPFPILAVEQVNPVASQDLLGNNSPKVVVVGTSYSSKPPEFGFVPYLSEALGTEVLNTSLNGGGPLGAMLAYFFNADVKQDMPKLLIWEIPNFTIPVWSYNPLSSTMFRQLMPVFSVQNKLLDSYSTSLKKTTEVNVSPRNLIGADFIKFNFDTFRTREVKVILNYENTDHNEVLTLKHSHANSDLMLSQYFLELKRSNGLKSIRLETAGEVGQVRLDIFRYIGVN